MDKIIKKSLFIFFTVHASHFPLHTIEPKITSAQIEFRKKENKIIFKKNVKITNGKNFILCDYAIKDDTFKIIYISGNIKGYYLIESTATIELNAESGRWQIEKNLIELTGKPYAVYVDTENRKLEITSERIEVDTGLNIMKFLKGITLNYGNSKAESEFAEYFYNEKKLVLAKGNNTNPVIYYSNGYSAKTLADSIVVDLGKNQLLFDKNVYSEISLP